MHEPVRQQHARLSPRRVPHRRRLPPRRVHADHDVAEDDEIAERVLREAQHVRRDVLASPLVIQRADVRVAAQRDGQLRARRRGRVQVSRERRSGRRAKDPLDELLRVGSDGVAQGRDVDLVVARRQRRRGVVAVAVAVAVAVDDGDVHAYRLVVVVVFGPARDEEGHRRRVEVVVVVVVVVEPRVDVVLVDDVDVLLGVLLLFARVVGSRRRACEERAASAAEARARRGAQTAPSVGERRGVMAPRE
eukprot:30908-Pelagococcus_subviridis.AAC.7